MKKGILLISALLLSGNVFAESIEVVERVKSGTGGYTIWSDGFIEQWGTKAAGADEIVFHVPFTDAGSISFVIQEYSFGDQYGRQPTNLPTINGVYDFNRSDMVGTWTAKGY